MEIFPMGSSSCYVRASIVESPGSHDREGSLWLVFCCSLYLLAC